MKKKTKTKDTKADEATNEATDAPESGSEAVLNDSTSEAPEEVSEVSEASEEVSGTPDVGALKPCKQGKGTPVSVEDQLAAQKNATLTEQEVPIVMLKTLDPPPRVGAWEGRTALGIPRMLCDERYTVPKNVAVVLVDAKKASVLLD